MIREAIKEELDRLRWSILRLSKEANVRNATLSEYLNGNKEMHSTNIEKCLNALNLSIKAYAEKIGGNRDFFENLSSEDLQGDKQLALLVLCLAYKRQERQTCMLDIRSFEYRNGNKLMVKIPALVNAILSDNMGDLEIAALKQLEGLKAVEIGEEGSTVFVQGLLFT
jgi:transcriptional regulator with XRE-family HTH domain